MKEAYRRGYEDARKFAEKMVNDFDKTSDMINDANEKIKGGRLGPLDKLVEDLKLMGDMLMAYIKGEYRVVPVSSIVAILGALIYVVNPFDVVPDFIPFLGHIDDAAVVMFVIKQVITDLKSFIVWRDGTKEDVKPN
jgi:uncharacterized membrane protein YkvA (DUF1232 family)